MSPSQPVQQLRGPIDLPFQSALRDGHAGP